MAVIDAGGQVIADSWVYPNSDHPAAASHVIHQLDEFLAGARPLARPSGVLFAPDTKISAVTPLLDQLDLVAIEFPKFRDGRGFTIARNLREQHGFRGDIRAVGHILPDQFAALIRCGFTSVLTPPDHPPDQWQKVVAHSSTNATRSGPLLRRLLSGRPSESS